MKENELVLLQLFKVMQSTEDLAVVYSFEKFLQEEDGDIHAWILDKRPFPPEYVKSGLVSLLEACKLKGNKN